MVYEKTEIELLKKKKKKILKKKNINIVNKELMI